MGWSQELPMQELNPKQEGRGIWLEIFAPTFFTQQQLRLDSLTLDWHHPEQGKIGFSEFWTYREGRGQFEKTTSGSRLTVRREYLLDFLQENGLDLLIEVRLRRSRPYRSGYKEEETYDHGTVRAFILTANGEVRLDMDQTLIERGHALIAEFSGDRANTLQKWMANYIVELMAAAESAGNERLAQDIKDRCAHMIMKLWQLKVNEDATQLQQTLWNMQRLPSDDFDYDLLNNALKNPPRAKELNSESVVAIFRHVEEAEHWLLRLLNIVGQPKEDTEDEVIRQYLDRAYAPDLVKNLAKIFTELDGLDIVNKDEVKTRVIEALSQLHELRTVLLDEDDSNEG